MKNFKFKWLLLSIILSIVSITHVDAATRTYYCKCTQSWWTKDGASIGCYAWKSSDESQKNADWPGEKMTWTGVEGEWSYELDTNFDRVIFTRLNGDGDVDWGAKTSDITLGDDNYYTITSESAVWGDPGCTYSATKYAPTPAIAGSMNSWRPDDNVFSGTTGSVTCSVTLAAKTSYTFKVEDGWSWYGCGNDGADPQTHFAFVGQSGTINLGNSSGSDSNIRLLSAGAGTYVFTYDCSEHTLSVAYPSVTHPNSNYVYFKNTPGWDPFRGHFWGGTTGTSTGWGNLPYLPTCTFAGETYYYAAIGDQTTGQITQKANGEWDYQTADLNVDDHFGQWYDVVNRSTESSEVPAHWKDFTVSVSLDNQGATTAGASSVTATYGSAMPSISDNKPAKTGNTFGGYYDAVGGGGTQYINASGTSTHVWDKTTASPTLYAKWSATITLNNQSATTAGTTSVAVVYNSTSNITSINTPSKNGWTFAGYYTGTNGAGSQLIDKDGNFNSSVASYITEGKWTGSGNVTLYAFWKNTCSATSYTLRYGTTGSADWAGACFSQVGSTAEWTIEDYTIPNKPNFFVGYNEEFYNSDLGSNNSQSYTTNWTTAYSDGNGAMKLLPGTSVVGLATGAVGTLQIWTNSSDKNLSVGFLPSGYGLTYATGTIAFNTWEETYFCETDVVTLTSSDASGTFQVKLAANSGYVATAHGTAEYAATLDGRKINDDDDIASGLKGVFQIWQDASANNFGLRFVTVHDVSFNMQDHGSAISDYTDIRYNSKISAPSDPSAAGYTFGGWYKEPACTNEWDFANNVVTEATTLYAKWTANTLTFDGSVASHETEWNNTGNWSEAIVPTIDHPVIISKPVTVNTNAAKAKSITFSGTGTLTIPATGALEVAGTIANTTAANIVIESSNTNQGALIFNSTGGTYATVEMALQYADPKVGKFQMVAIPIPYVNVSDAFAGTGAYTFAWKHGTGWDQRGYYDGFSSFEAVLVKGKAGTSFSGALVSTSDFSSGSLSYDGTVDNGDVHMFGNSWTAPIRRTNVSCTNATISILDGSTQKWDGVVSGELIPALQGYAVVVGSTGGSFSINYTNAVRTATTPNEPLHAPKRYAEADPEPITLYVSGNELRTRIRLFEDETRFSDALDEGWEAYYMEGNGYVGEMYAVGPEKKMNVLATANLEGTVVGFVPGQATDYTLSFAGDGKGYYLNDMKTGKSTRIDEANTYEFTSDPNTNATRFVISKTPMSPTGIEDVVDGSNARKQMIDGMLYIIRDGRIYNAEGSLVK